MRPIDADALEKDGWYMSRTVQINKETNEFQTRKPTDFPTIAVLARWTPVTEALPKKSGEYYVSGGGKVWICEYLILPNFIGGWCNEASNPVVQAWMPLPEPYKGGEG